MKNMKLCFCTGEVEIRSIDLEITQEAYEGLSEEEKHNLILEGLPNLVDVWVEAEEDEN